MTRAPVFRSRQHAGGFSLIEMLVSVVIMVIAVLALLTLFDRSNKAARVENSVTDSQQNARYASYQVVREARMAGAGGVPASVSGVQIGVSLSIGTSSYNAGTDDLVNNVNATNDTVFVATTHHIRVGTDVLHIRGIISSDIYDLGTSSWNPSNGNLTIQQCTKFTDPTASTTSPCYPFGANDLSYFSSFDSTQPRLFVMSDSLGNVGVALLKSASCGSSSCTLTLDTSGNAYAKSLNPTGSFNPYLTTPTRGGVLDDLLYFVDDGTAAGKTCGTANQNTDPGPCHPQLAVAQWGAGTAGGCTVSASDPFACATVTPIADDIEDMQVAYGIDFYNVTSGQGSFASPTSTPDGSISITAQSTFNTIVSDAQGTTAPNQDPSFSSTAGGDEWIWNVGTGTGGLGGGPAEPTSGTFNETSDLSELKAAAVWILAKGTNPDPTYVGLGAKTWPFMDSQAQTVSQQNGFAYHRRLIPMRVNFRNYQTQ